MPVHFPELAGKVYRPSNGTEGMLFENQFCDVCSREDVEIEMWCDIHNRMLGHDEDDTEYPKEVIYNKEGEPTCTVFCQKREELQNPQTFLERYDESKTD